jgi:mercuric reductase
VREALVRLDAEDLLQLRGQRIELAYPFSAAPTAFVVDLGDSHGERFSCCAVDALGLAPMLGRPIHIRSRCHHCAAPLALSVSPSGPEPEAAGMMVWVGKRAEDRRACDSL